eukprot:78636-Prymnesium_polylepis.4
MGNWGSDRRWNGVASACPSVAKPVAVHATWSRPLSTVSLFRHCATSSEFAQHAHPPPQERTIEYSDGCVRTEGVHRVSVEEDIDRRSDGDLPVGVFDATLAEQVGHVEADRVHHEEERRDRDGAHLPLGWWPEGRLAVGRVERVAAMGRAPHRLKPPGEAEQAHSERASAHVNASGSTRSIAAVYRSVA